MFHSNKSRLLMKISAVVVFLALVLVIHSFMFDVKIESDGIVGVKWESDINDAPAMKLLAQNGDLKFYTRDDDKMKFYDVPVDKIVYGYYKGRFYNAMIYYSGLESLSGFKEMLSRQYGDPYQTSQPDKKYFWEANNVNLFLVYDLSVNKGRVSYFFKPIADEMEAREKAKEEKNSGSHDTTK